MSQCRHCLVSRTFSAGEAVSEAGATGALTPEVLAALPDELIGRMREAAMNADLDQLLTLTDEVERYDSRSCTEAAAVPGRI